MTISWLDFKQFVDSKNLPIQWIQIGSKYHLHILHGAFDLSCVVFIEDIPGEEQTDFETNYKNEGNKQPKLSVIAEPANISITLYKATDIVTVAASLSATIDILLEPVSSETQQILYGGALYAQNPDFADHIKFQIIDINNVLGYGANTVLKEYVSKAYLNNHGTFEDYDEAGAYLPVGLYLRCIYTNTKTEGTTKVKINYLLGIPNA